MVDADLNIVRRRLSEQSVFLKRDARPNVRAATAAISAQVKDHANDLVVQNGIDFAIYNKNPVVSDAHDTVSMPVAISTPPQTSGSGAGAVTFASATFPEPGVSKRSDEIFAALNAGLIKGASIGFIPLRWAWSKDPTRPGGVDFIEIRVLEWALCSVPCCPVCLVFAVSSGVKSTGRSARNVPLDDVPQNGSHWQCCAISTMPINATDDPFDPVAAKKALLAQCSITGTISDEARRYFLASDLSAPFDVKSYKLPFCSMTDSGVIASKTGWRLAIAALEKSDLPGNVHVEARAIVERLEARLGDTKIADRRRQARALAAQARAISNSIPPPLPQSRAQRMADARKISRIAREAQR